MGHSLCLPGRGTKLPIWSPHHKLLKNIKIPDASSFPCAALFFVGIFVAHVECSKSLFCEVLWPLGCQVVKRASVTVTISFSCLIAVYCYTQTAWDRMLSLQIFELLADVKIYSERDVCLLLFDSMYVCVRERLCAIVLYLFVFISFVLF